MRPNSCQWQFLFISISFVSIFQHYITIIQYWSLNLKKKCDNDWKRNCQNQGKRINSFGTLMTKIIFKIHNFIKEIKKNRIIEYPSPNYSCQ